MRRATAVAASFSSSSSATSMESQVLRGCAQQSAERHLLRQRDRRQRATGAIPAGVGGVRGGGGHKQLLRFALFSLKPIFNVIVNSSAAATSMMMMLRLMIRRGVPPAASGASSVGLE